MGKIIKLNIDLSVLYEHAERIEGGIDIFIKWAQIISIHFFPDREKGGCWFCHSPDVGYYKIFLPRELAKLLNEVEVYNERGEPINPEDRIAEELSKKGDVLFIRIYNGYEYLFSYILIKQWGEGRWKKKLKT